VLHREIGLDEDMGDTSGDADSDAESKATEGTEPEPDPSGSDGQTNSTISPIRLDQIAAGQGGFAIDAERWGDVGTLSISGIGDLDGDARSDLFLGGITANTGSAPSYVVFGKSGGDTVFVEDVAAGRGGFLVSADTEGPSTVEVAAAGDVDGYGVPDLLMSLTFADAESRPDRAYVVFGRSDGNVASLEAVARGEGGFTIEAENTVESAFLTSLAAAGDVDGDGRADIVLGASNAGATISGSGRCYVVFGKANGDPVQLTDVAGGMGGFAVDGEPSSGYAGDSVSSAGDMNGDGLDDILIGAGEAGPTGGGRAYVIFGRANGDRVSLVDIAAGEGGFSIDGASGQFAGGASASPGDVNGDGVPDVVVGALGVDTGYSGRAYVVFGKSDGTSVALEDVARGIGGFVMDGELGDGLAGSYVAGLRDVNGDGLDEIVVGAPYASPGRASAGRTYVVYGKNDTDSIQLDEVARGVGGFAIDGELASGLSGPSPGTAGDIDGDGTDDLVLSASVNVDGFDSALSFARAYVVFGGDFSNARK